MWDRDRRRVYVRAVFANGRQQSETTGPGGQCPSRECHRRRRRMKRWIPGTYHVYRYRYIRVGSIYYTGTGCVTFGIHNDIELVLMLEVSRPPCIPSDDSRERSMDA